MRKHDQTIIGKAYKLHYCKNPEESEYFPYIYKITTMKGSTLFKAGLHSETSTKELRKILIKYEKEQGIRGYQK